MKTPQIWKILKAFFFGDPYKIGCAGLRPEEISKIMREPVTTPAESSPFAKTVGRIMASK